MGFGVEAQELVDMGSGNSGMEDDHSEDFESSLFELLTGLDFPIGGDSLDKQRFAFEPKFASGFEEEKRDKRVVLEFVSDLVEDNFEFGGTDFDAMGVEAAKQLIGGKFSPLPESG